jgi:hypothetical protein
MDRNSTVLYLSVITVAEVEEGIARSRRIGAGSKAKQLSDWLETLLHLYAARVLPVDAETARHLGRLADHARGLGLSPGLADLVIAATARQHGCTILTRNLRHFTPLGVAALDPLEVLPETGG